MGETTVIRFQYCTCETLDALKQVSLFNIPELFVLIKLLIVFIVSLEWFVYSQKELICPIIRFTIRLPKKIKYDVFFKLSLSGGFDMMKLPQGVIKPEKPLINVYFTSARKTVPGY